MSLLIYNLHEKGITEKQDRRNLDIVRANCNLHSCLYSFVYHDSEAKCSAAGHDLKIN